MGIERIEARLNAIAARQNSVMQKPAMFQAILEEKLGIPAAGSEVNSAVQSTAAQDYLSAAAQSYIGGAMQNASGTTTASLAQQAQPYMQYIQNASAKYNIPTDLILGVIKAESDFNPNSVSYAGAMGLMQLMPENCAEDGVTNPFDPAQNIEAGTAEISRFLDKYNGDLKLALAAYNTGPGNLSKRNVVSSQSAEYQTVPQIVRDYVDRVLRYAGYQA